MTELVEGEYSKKSVPGCLWGTNGQAAPEGPIVTVFRT
jgi:hypothetical protein